MPLNAIRQFIRSEGRATDSELRTTLTAVFSELPPDARSAWFRQAELTLDGYGGERNLNSVQRINAVLLEIEKELVPK